ncbi:hypothetical protein DFH08DRAFT_988475, partial [Mycena albidolilacea]
PALFHGHEDHDGDVYRPFVSGFDNNPLVLSAELPALLWLTGGFRFATPCLRPSRYALSILFHFRCIFLAHLMCLFPDSQRACVLVPFCGSFPQAAFLSARSPSHSPSLCTPRSRPVPFAPLALVVLLPLLRALCLRCRPQTLKWRHRRVTSLLLPQPIRTSSVHRLLSPVRATAFCRHSPYSAPTIPISAHRVYMGSSSPSVASSLKRRIRLPRDHSGDSAPPICSRTTYPCRLLHAARPPLAVPTPIADAVLAHPLDSTLSRIGYNSHLHLHAQCPLRPYPFPAPPFSLSRTRATAVITTQCAHHTPARFGVTLISAWLGCRIFPVSLTTFLSPSSPRSFSTPLQPHSPDARLLHGNPPMAMRSAPRRRAELVRRAFDASICCSIGASPSSLRHPCITEKQGKDEEHNADVRDSAISVAIAGETIPANSELWLDRVSRVRKSDGRMELHAMLVSDGAQGRFWVLPLRTNRSFTRDSVACLGPFEDGTAGLIEAVENLEIAEDTVEIH